MLHLRNLTCSIHLGAITVSGVPEAVHNINPDIEPFFIELCDQIRTIRILMVSLLAPTGALIVMMVYY